MAKKKKLGSSNPKYNTTSNEVLTPTKEVVSYATIRTTPRTKTKYKAKVTAVWY